MTIETSTATVLSYGFVQGSNGYYLLQQEQPHPPRRARGYPVSGVLRVSDAQGDYLRIIARGDHFSYQYYASDQNP